MANIKKLGRPTDERLAILRSQATDLLWNGKLETTLDRAKATRSYAEKIITLAVNSYEDTVKVEKEVKNAKGEKVKVEVINDGPKKLNARREIMNRIYHKEFTRAEKESKAAFVERTRDIAHPLVEKIFNELAPKYAKRKEENNGIGGGYTRIIKLGNRKGDNAQVARIELI